MNFVYCADEDNWDNNDGDNYLIIVNDANLRKPIPQELKEKFDEEANKIWADKYGAALFFTVPEKLKVLLRGLTTTTICWKTSTSAVRTNLVDLYLLWHRRLESPEPST